MRIANSHFFWYPQAAGTLKRTLEQFAGVVVTALINYDKAIRLMAPAISFAKTLNQHHSAEVCQMRLVERKTQCLQAFAHHLGRKKSTNSAWAETSLLVRFLHMHQNVHFDRKKQG